MQSNTSSDLALRVLRLEQQIEAYQRLHAEELAELRQLLAEVKNAVLNFAGTTRAGTPSANHRRCAC